MHSLKPVYSITRRIGMHVDVRTPQCVTQRHTVSVLRHRGGHNLEVPQSSHARRYTFLCEDQVRSNRVCTKKSVRLYRTADAFRHSRPRLENVGRRAPRRCERLYALSTTGHQSRICQDARGCNLHRPHDHGHATVHGPRTRASRRERGIHTAKHYGTGPFTTLLRFLRFTVKTLSSSTTAIIDRIMAST